MISTQQCTALGLPTSALRWHVENGDLQRVGRSVFRLTIVPRSWNQVAHALLLRIRCPAALSHGTAAWLHGLDGFAERPTLLDVTCTQRVTLDSRHRLHCSVVPLDAVTVRGLRTTSLARTLIDLAESPDANVEALLSAAHRRDAGLLWQLERFEREFPGHERHGLAKLRHAVARHPRFLDSRLEDLVLVELRRTTLPRATAGYSVFHHGTFVTKVDFAWPGLKVALHCDSRAFHLRDEQFDRDVRQRSTLVGLGWTNVLVSWKTVRESFWKEALRAALFRDFSAGPPPRDQLSLLGEPRTI